MIKSSKAEFLRGVVLFNPSLHTPSSESARDRVSEKIAEYFAQDGGTWNYDDLYDVIRKALKGVSPDDALLYLKDLKGPGEAAAKTMLFRSIYKELRLSGASFIDAGMTVITLEGERSVGVRPDFAYRLDGKIHHAFVYPNSTPALKQSQKDMLIASLARPFAGAQDEYLLCLVEFPKIGERRECMITVHPFEYRGVEQSFLDHLDVYYQELEAGRDQGELF